MVVYAAVRAVLLARYFTNADPLPCMRAQAILHVEDETFWEGTPFLEFGHTPELQEHVLVAGYPTGGDTISLSTGVVSRSELQRYAHGGGTQLALQIDASINPGNSGGPALLDDGSCTVAGVAFQSLNNSDGIGYIIPCAFLALKATARFVFFFFFNAGDPTRWSSSVGHLNSTPSTGTR